MALSAHFSLFSVIVVEYNAFLLVFFFTKFQQFLEYFLEIVTRFFAHLEEYIALYTKVWSVCVWSVCSCMWSYVIIDRISVYFLERFSVFQHIVAQYYHSRFCAENLKN